ncbi:MAG TPA: glutathione S-transferase [Dokdonella sp.]|uniref:glutathione S-transferase n=1 Tax=Dokdonella sp. TaxID=2291710 RepID=UPI002D7EF250|nr:glutathione S-transferase [Dokdonella sp.]HET9033693.1 glutathione S-transferase [Dokdonella sp.]
MRLPILYSFRRCPYAMRARMALLVSGQQVELREVRLRDKPVELLAASPKGTVPVLIGATGQVIDESLDIMLWALRRNDPENWLPATDEAMADALALIGDCDGPFKSSLDRYKYPNRHPGTDSLVHREQGAEFLTRLEQRLETHDWLSGTHAGLADYAIMPFVRQFSGVDSAWFESQNWPQLKTRLMDIGASRLFDEAMVRIHPWTPFSPVTLFPASISE